jgi:hypothetical protein
MHLFSMRGQWVYVNLRGEVAAVTRNRYGVEKTVDTHKILINAIQFYVCLIIL